MGSTQGKDNGQVLVSRRRFLYGTAAAGAGAALGLAGLAGASGMAGLTGCSAAGLGGGGGEVSYLEVPESALSTQNDFEALDDPYEKVQLEGAFELPYGTLLWASSDEVAACLLPTATGSPLAQAGLLFLGSGTLVTMLDEAVGAKERFEIYDVRASSSGLVWTEANVMEGTWRVYTLKHEDGERQGEPILVAEGDDAYDTPMLAVAGDRAFWQVLPKLPNDDGLPSRLMGATFGRSDVAVVLENERRMATPPYSAADSVTVTPRLDMSTVHYQLTNIAAKGGAVADTMTLPASMTPLEAGYGKNGFMFSFANIYDYGDGISNLGTYTPMRKPSDGDYSAVKWFGFARTPTAPPAWCNDLLIVKSSYSVCGVDLAARTYVVIDVDDGADDYGEYLASTGAGSRFVTYANIDHQPIDAPAQHCCRVKVWTTT